MYTQGIQEATYPGIQGGVYREVYTRHGTRVVYSRVTYLPGWCIAGLPTYPGGRVYTVVPTRVVWEV